MTVLVVVDCRSGELRRYLKAVGTLRLTHEAVPKDVSMVLTPHAIQNFLTCPSDAFRVGPVSVLPPSRPPLVFA